METLEETIKRLCEKLDRKREDTQGRAEGGEPLKPLGASYRYRGGESAVADANLITLRVAANDDDWSLEW